MSIPLYLGNQLVITDGAIEFNLASVSVKAPVSDLNIANKIYVDTADSALGVRIVAEESARIAADSALGVRIDAEGSARSVADAKLLSAMSKSSLVPLTDAVCGGQALPTVMTSAVSELGYDGWYYKKTLTDSVNRKINWYVGPDIAMTVGGLQQMFFELNLINTASTPFITIYTKTDSITANAGSWYKSKRTYEVLNKVGLAANTNYCCFMKFNAESPDPVSYGHANRALLLSDVVANSVGAFASSEQVLTIAFGTDSIASVGNVEFICKSICVQSSAGTENFMFSNVHVESKALSTQVNNLYQYFFGYNRDGAVPTRV